ncbi:MAG: S1C family serine protease, partial [Actinobacteria bacterium]|nr:S1C family serine protease [Actinomycetota bacterium]
VLGIFEEPVPPPPPTIPPPPVLTAPAPTGPPPTFGDSITATEVAARVIPSTVAIVTTSLFGQAGGSGVIYGNDGYIITNHHVVEGNDEVSVIFADGARFPATVIGSDPVTDLGVLLVDREDVTPLEIGSSADLAIGEPAVAVGNPLGLEGGPTVTSGIVSALDRSLDVSLDTTLYGLVQTDAPIAPGSSGGALVDAEGRLIGITTAIAVSNVGAEGLGFAVPIDLAVGVVNDLIADGEVRHARLGIEGTTAWADEGGAEFPVGVGVQDLTLTSAFEDAGGQINDVIVAVAGTEVETLEELLGILRRHRSGDQVEVRILRGDTQRTIQVTLGSLG